MSQSELRDELLVRGGLLERVEVHPMQVLHDGLFEGESVIDLVLDEDGHHLQSGQGGRAPASLPRDQLVLVRRAVDGTHDERLQDADLA